MKENQTLLDWTANSDNFKNNGTEIMEIVKEAVYQTQIKGLKGSYKFEKATTVNSGGFTPVTLTMHKGKGKQSIIALYKGNQQPKFEIFYDNIAWKTRDGLPPKDSVEIVNVYVRWIGMAELAILICKFTLFSIYFLSIFFSIALGSILFLAVVSFVVCSVYWPPMANKLVQKRTQFCIFDHLIVLGICLMLFQIATIPLNGKSDLLHINCNAGILCTFIGYSILIYSLNNKILIKVKHGITRLRHEKMPLVCFGIWITLQSVLIGIFLHSLQITTAAIQDLPSGDGSQWLGIVQIQSKIHYECSIDRMFSGNATALSMLSLIVVSQISFIIFTIYLIFKIRNVCDFFSIVFS